MPAKARGTTYATKTRGVGIRWKENGQTQRRAGFRTKTEARDWFDDHVAPRLSGGAPGADITLDRFCDLYLERWGATVAPRTRRTVQDRLKPARDTFGNWTLRELEHAAGDIARWRATMTEQERFRATGALRQTLFAAVRWRHIHRNPAVDAGENPAPRVEELTPFTPTEIDALEIELGPVYGPMVVVLAETGPRTNEWPAFERRDVDKRNPAIHVQRRYANGRLVPYPKTERSRRRIPLTPRAVEALEQLPVRLDTPILFPASRGGRIQLDTWRTRHWYPALEAAGIPQRGPYLLRHTFATEALAAGVPVFDLARVMGTSVEMINETYGHLAQDSEASIRARLAARSDRKGQEGVTGQ